MSLDHLEQYDKETCLKILEDANLDELWNRFLFVQTTLFFEQESHLQPNENLRDTAVSEVLIRL